MNAPDANAVFTALVFVVIFALMIWMAVTPSSTPPAPAPAPEPAEPVTMQCKRTKFLGFPLTEICKITKP